MCGDGVALECGQRFALYEPRYPKLRLAVAFDWGPSAHTHTHTPITILRKMWVPSFASLCLDMYSCLFNMNKCRLKNELERKTNKRPMGGSLGKFSTVLFLSARLQKTEGERERAKRAELWKGRGTERGRGWTCLARKGRKIDKKSDRERNAA